jgi:hypothetical protein
MFLTKFVDSRIRLSTFKKSLRTDARRVARSMEKIYLLLLLSLGSLHSQALDQRVIRCQSGLELLSRINLVQDQSSVFISNLPQIKEALNLSTKKFKVIYFFSPNCLSSVSMFPKIYSFYKTHQFLFEFIPISGYRLDKVSEIEKYMQQYNFHTSILILDTQQYGNAHNPFKRLDLVSKEFCPSCISKRMGYSDMFILNDQNQVVYSSTYDISGEENYNMLVKTILD